jgi:single-strand DNA-binding protein
MLNQVILIGHLVKDIELKILPSGKEVTSFSLAVQRNFKNQENEYDTDFINCVAFGNTAKLLSQYCFKGQLICVSGRLQIRSWESEQGRRYATEVIVNNIEVLEWKEKKSIEEKANKFFDEVPTRDISEDDLPF